MRSAVKKREHNTATFVLLDARKCTACWKCLEICTNHVIGRINLPFHKHARINNGNNCTACLKCVKICESHALYKA